ncbi:hypothetical protein [Phocaeicola plebeius]|jgi:hypothetical protein|uniref:Uncharacterized protein n=1 Tax=Phocaeicola plebeius TaxID=310297 RepID=A0A3E4N3N5_9BACT|nr:hypothetical protein [Phocaeicola plebeius]RGK56256.1 hypothetical protein DXD04_07000 [Phocaeicola plebeius]
MKRILFFIVCCIFSMHCIFSQTLYIYGGEDHDVFLGKLNASKYDSKSIWNEYGTYGSEYNTNSIWNEYGTYGSAYSSYSPFNSYASYPPVIVDEEGNFYGYFTVNKYKSKRANFDLVNIICEYYESIREDVDEWYDKIF